MLAKSGGSSNAFTDMQDTNYFFDVSVFSLSRPFGASMSFEILGGAGLLTSASFLHVLGPASPPSSVPGAFFRVFQGPLRQHCLACEIACMSLLLIVHGAARLNPVPTLCFDFEEPSSFAAICGP